MLGQDMTSSNLWAAHAASWSCNLRDPRSARRAGARRPHALTVGLAASVLWSCGPGIENADPFAQVPLLTLHGRVTSPAGASITADMKVALLWGTRGFKPKLCGVLPDAPAIQAECNKPVRRFRPRLPSDPLAPIEQSDGAFSLHVYSLPPTEVVVGDPSSRVAVGTLAVLKNETWSNGSDLPQGPFLGSMPRDIVAALAPSNDMRHTRIHYQEGRTRRNEHVYPAPECPDWPAGFSAFDVQPASDTSEADCTPRALSEPFEIDLVMNRVRTKMPWEPYHSMYEVIEVEEESAPPPRPRPPSRNRTDAQDAAAQEEIDSKYNPADAICINAHSYATSKPGIFPHSGKLAAVVTLVSWCNPVVDGLETWPKIPCPPSETPHSDNSERVPAWWPCSR